jgi:predicted transcriptional regulator
MLFSSSSMVRDALKGKAYANKPRTIQELENNIRREISAISQDVLQATFANMKRRVQICLDSGGEDFQHLL